MASNNRNRSPPCQRMTTELEGRYGKIGIPAVAAAARYSSEHKKARRSIKDAGGGANKHDGNRRSSNHMTRFINPLTQVVVVI